MSRTRSEKTKCRPGCKAGFICLKIMNTSGRCPPEAEAFFSQSVPKTQSPGTLSLYPVYFLNTYIINN